MKSREGAADEAPAIRQCPICQKTFPKHVSDTQVYIHADRCVDHANRRRKATTKSGYSGNGANETNTAAEGSQTIDPFKKQEPPQRKRNDKRKRGLSKGKQTEKEPSSKKAATAKNSAMYMMQQQENSPNSFCLDTNAAEVGQTLFDTMGISLNEEAWSDSNRYSSDIVAAHNQASAASASLSGAAGMNKKTSNQAELTFVNRHKYSHYPSGQKPSNGIPLLMPVGGRSRTNDIWLSVNSRMARLKYHDRTMDVYHGTCMPYSETAVRELNKKRTATITQFARGELAEEMQVKAFDPLNDPDYSELFETPLISEKGHGLTDTLWSGEWTQFIFGGIVLVGKVLSVERRSNRTNVYKARLWSSGDIVDVPTSAAYRIKAPSVDVNYYSWDSIANYIADDFKKSKNTVQWKSKMLGKPCNLKPHSLFGKLVPRYNPGDDPKLDIRAYCCQRWEDCCFNVQSVMNAVLERMVRVLRGASNKGRVSLTSEHLVPQKLRKYRDTAVEGTLKAFEYLIEEDSSLSFPYLRKLLREQFLVWFLTRCWSIRVNAWEIFNPTPLHTIPNVSEYIAWKGCTKEVCETLKAYRQNTLSSPFYSPLQLDPSLNETHRGETRELFNREKKPSPKMRPTRRKENSWDSDRVRQQALQFLESLDAPIVEEGLS